MARSKKETPELNGAGMSDISFLLLSFFLMTSNMDQTSGLQRRLPPMPPEDRPQTDPENKVKKRNVFQVKINQWDGIFAGGAPMDLSMLRQEVKDFILNPTNHPDKSEKIEQVIGGRKYMISEAVISLQNDRGTSYETYIKVQNELVAAYNELRDEFTRQEFGGRAFDQLTEDEQNVVRDVIPQRISEAEPKDISASNRGRRR